MVTFRGLRVEYRGLSFCVIIDQTARPFVVMCYTVGPDETTRLSRCLDCRNILRLTIRL